VIQTILFLHILAGVAVGSAKGGGLHRRAGAARTPAMLLMGLSAPVLAALITPVIFWWSARVTRGAVRP